MLILTFIWILIVHFQQEVFSLCTLPAQFQNSVWIDSDKGELVFDTVNMTGWDFRDKGGTPYEDWQCFNTSTVGTKLYLIMVNTQNVMFLSDEFTPYLCMELTEITSNSYYYYLSWAEEEKYRDERISATASTTIVSNPVGELCLDLNIPAHAAAYPDTGEYHVLVKKGNELDAKQQCPSTFFGEYSYKVTDIAATTDYCGTGDEVWDVCTDYEQMTFNYTICNTEIAYSGNGSVFCLVSITSGSYTYHTVYNEDDIVDVSSGTYRFACLMSSIASDGSLNVSQTPGSCKKSQTPNNQPVFAYNSSTAGLNLQLTPRRLCPKTDEDTSSSGVSTGAIVGIVFGVLIFIAAIVLLCLLCVIFKGKQQKTKAETKDKTPATSPRSNTLSVDIDDVPHQLSPHWIHGPHGTAPMETKFSGDHKISNSPTLDHNYNPFSVLPLGKRKKGTGEEIQNGVSQSPIKLLNERENASKKPQMVIKQSELKKNVDIHEKKETATSSKNIHSVKLLIEDLEKADNNVIIPDRPGGSADKKSMPKLLPNDFAQESFQTFQTEANTTISRNSNITPNAIVLEANGFNDETTNIQDLKGQLPVEDTEEYRSGYTKTPKRELESADKEVSVFSRSSYKHNIQRNQLREASLTPILVTENTSKTSEVSKKAVPPTEHSLPDNHKIIKTHFKREDLKYVGTFIKVSKTPPPGPDDEKSFKGRKKNKVLARSHSSMIQTEKAKKPKTATKFFKVKGKSNKKGQQALNSLIISKSVGVHKNKKGTFYNEDIPTVTEPESYLHISELNDTDTGICYDEENEKARALGHWNNDSHSLVTNVTNLSGNHDRCKSNEMKLALGTTHGRSISRLTSSTDLSLRGSVSTRSINAITSRIDSRGAKYFIENESSSIAIHVKISDFPDDQGATDLVGSNVNNVENNNNQDNEEYEDEDEDDDEAEDEDDDEDEDEDEEEDDDDCDEAKEASNDTIETSMSVLYGTPNEEEEEDPDRMILRGYEHDLVTIKE